MRLLVVEDDTLLGHDLVELLSDAGFDVVGLARKVSDAIDIIRGSGCDAALLDVNLGAESADPIAAELTMRGIPFIGLSGYTREQMPRAFANASVLLKPVRFQVLVTELKRMAHDLAAKTGDASA